jgi:Na+-driven multidrug efflux pump
VFLFLNIFPAAFLSIYGQNEQFISLGIPVVRVVAVARLFMSVGTIWLNAVTGTGNGRITFIIELIAISLYCIYVYLVLELNRLSIVWGWMSELIYWSVLFTLSYWYIKSKRWHATVI